jgi:hypothetical protein
MVAARLGVGDERYRVKISPLKQLSGRRLANVAGIPLLIMAALAFFLALFYPSGVKPQINKPLLAGSFIVLMVAAWLAARGQTADLNRRLDNIQAVLIPPEKPKKETEQAQLEELAKEEREGTIYLAASTFTPESVERLRSRLAGIHGRVNISALMNDSHSLWDARQLAQAFRSASWVVTGVDRVGGFSVTPKGIYILARSLESGFAGFVQSALQQSIGVEAKGSVVPTMPEGEIDIIVGETEW